MSLLCNFADIQTGVSPGVCFSLEHPVRTVHRRIQSNEPVCLYLCADRAEKLYEEYDQFRAVVKHDGKVHWEPAGMSSCFIPGRIGSNSPNEDDCNPSVPLFFLYILILLRPLLFPVRVVALWNRPRASVVLADHTFVKL